MICVLNQDCSISKLDKQCINVNNCTGWNIWSSQSIYILCTITWVSNYTDPPMHWTVNEQHLVPHWSSFEWLSHGVQLAKMEVRLGNWSKGQYEMHIYNPLDWTNQSLRPSMTPQKQNTVHANDDIKCLIPHSSKINVSLDMFIETPIHFLLLWIVKSVMEVSDNYMKQYRLGNKFISHANTYIAQLPSFCLEFLQIQPLPKTNYFSEWCLGMACVFLIIYDMVTISVEPTIHYCWQIHVNGVHNVCHGGTSNVTASKIITTTITIHQVVFGLLLSILQGNGW